MTDARLKTHWKKLHNPDYLGAYALTPGEDMIVTVDHVRKETITGADGKTEECIVAHFRDGVKPMILNATNAKMLQKLCKSPFVEDWAGTSIQLYAENVRAFGDVVEALRIRPRLPVKTKPELSPSSPNWGAAITAVREGQTTVAKIREKYTLSAESARQLTEEGGNHAES